MSTQTIANSGIINRRPARRQSVIPSSILGTSIFVLTEIMFFTALISAYMVIKAGTASEWIPPTHVRLPVAATGFNTFVLLCSGGLLYLSGKKFLENKTLGLQLFSWSMFLAGFFVVFQGSEWVQLIMHGMTLNTGVFSACFFLLVGLHGLHALSAVIVMAFVYGKMKRDEFTQTGMTALQIYWFFIVAVWPIIYGLVYF